MIDEPQQEQAAMFVFGLLEGDELVAFEQARATDAELDQLTREWEATAASLAHVAPARPLPPSLKARVLARGAAPVAARGRAPFVASWVPWALAASLMIGCVLLAGERLRLQHQIRGMTDYLAKLQDDYSAVKERAQAFQQRLTQSEHRVAELTRRDLLSQVRIATLTSKLNGAPAGTAVVIWDAERQKGVLKVDKMPPLAPDRDYELWVVDPKYENPVAAGTFQVGADGAQRVNFEPGQRIETAGAFAVSVERKGGVPKAEGPIVLLGK